MVFRTLYDPPTIYQTTKTTIVHGVIQRKDIWKDTKGNEYNKLNGKFTPMINQVKHVPRTFLEMEQELTSSFDFLTICIIVGFLFLIFLCGLLVGSSRKRSHCKKKKISKKL